MFNFLLDNFVPSLINIISLTSAIITLISLFVKFDKKTLPQKTGIIVIICIFAIVFLISLSYLIGQYSISSPSPTAVSDASPTPVAVINTESNTSSLRDNNSLISNNSGVIINGNNNTVNPLPTNQEDTQTTINISEFFLDYAELELEVGASQMLHAKVLYTDNHSDHIVTWCSSNDSIVTVDQDGVLHAKAIGVATIVAQASNNNLAKTKECIVTVSAPFHAPSGYSIRLNKESAHIGEPFTLYVTPNEENITNIQIHTLSPSGIHKDFPYGNNGEYYIDTECGIWTIYASITNAKGTYNATKLEDYVTISILSISDYFNKIY